MLKRLWWFLTGTAFGFWLAVRLGRSVRESVERYTPEQVAGRLADATAHFRHDLRAAVREGRAAMREREAELRSRRQPIEPLVSGQGRGSEM